MAALLYEHDRCNQHDRDKANHDDAHAAYEIVCHGTFLLRGLLPRVRYTDRHAPAGRKMTLDSTPLKITVHGMSCGSEAEIHFRGGPSCQAMNVPST